jgi:hypothetical protein
MVRAVYFIADQPPNGHRVDGYHNDSAPVEYSNATRHIWEMRELILTSSKFAKK